MPAASCAQPEFECLRGAMGALGEEPCLSHFILLGEGSLRRALKNFCEHYHGERNHQGKANKLLFPRPGPRKGIQGSVRCQKRLGGLLKYYHREAA